MLTLGLGFAAVPTRALADGDPASDVLVAERIFVPSDVPESHDLRAALSQSFTRLNAEGVDLKVALIGSRADLGAIPALYGRPQLYVRYLDIELSLRSPRPLLVVMADGYGVAGLPDEIEREILRLPAPSSGLAAGALTAMSDVIVALRGHHSTLQRSSASTPFVEAARPALFVGFGVLVGLTALALLVVSLRWRGQTLAELASARLPRTPPARATAAVGAIWLADALARLLSLARGSAPLSTLISPTGAAQPHWFESTLASAQRLLRPEAMLWSILLTAVQIAIVVMLMTGRRNRPVIFLSVPLLALLWWFGDGAGQVFDGGATALGGQPGEALLLAAAGLIAVDGAGGSLARPGWTMLWTYQSATWVAAAAGHEGSAAAALRNAPSGMSWLSSIQLSLAKSLSGSADGRACLLLGLMSILVAGGVWAGASRRVSLWAGVAISVVYWVLGQGFGGVLGGFGVGVGSGPAVAVIAYLIHLLQTNHKTI